MASTTRHHVRESVDRALREPTDFQTQEDLAEWQGRMLGALWVALANLAAENDRLRRRVDALERRIGR